MTPHSGMVFSCAGSERRRVTKIHERTGHPADEISEVSIQA